MTLVFASKHFEIVVPPHPHVTRTDGGHLIINPKVAVLDRTQLDAERSIELAKLTAVAGEAMATVLTQRGIEIGRITIRTTATGATSCTCTSTAVRVRRSSSRGDTSS